MTAVDLIARKASEYSSPIGSWSPSGTNIVCRIPTVACNKDVACHVSGQFIGAPTSPHGSPQPTYLSDPQSLILPFQQKARPGHDIISGTNPSSQLTMLVRPPTPSLKGDTRVENTELIRVKGNTGDDDDQQHRGCYLSGLECDCHTMCGPTAHIGNQEAFASTAPRKRLD